MLEEETCEKLNKAAKNIEKNNASGATYILRTFLTLNTWAMNNGGPASATLIYTAIIYTCVGQDAYFCQFRMHQHFP